MSEEQLPAARTIRWGMIGAGKVTENKSGPGFYRARNSALVAVSSRDPEKAADYARRHSIERSTGNPLEIIDADDIDAVYIATPTSSHHEFVLRASAAGKHVYVEKPMGMTHQQCESMVLACAAAGVGLWVGYYRRALPRITAIKDLLDSEDLGKIRSVTVRLLSRPDDVSGLGWRADPSISGGGLFFENACHSIDLLDHLLGPLVQARGFAAVQANAGEGEDIVAGSFRFRSGVLGSGLWCYNAQRDLSRVEIDGSLGSVSFSVGSPGPTVIDRSGHVETVEIPDPEHVHQPTIQLIVDELNGDGECVSTGVSAARTAKVVEDLLAKFRQQSA